MSDADIPALRLKRNEERRLRAGHVWVYSNEVDTTNTPLKHLVPGQQVVVEDHRGKALGRAYANPHSLICARLFTRNPRQALDEALLSRRIEQAVALREKLFGGHSYRAVFGEADQLPGLVIDRFRDVFVLQTGTAGMEQVQQQVAEILQRLYQPRAIVARNESGVRALEGLDSYSRALFGEMPDELSLQENGISYHAPLSAGQKTGWFYDHRAARRRLPPLTRNARVLDVFSYCGAWGVLAAAHGATEVLCLDSSRTALDFACRNARENGVESRLDTLCGDAVEGMKQLLTEGRRFDLVILDPPAFIKRKKDFRNGLAGYHAINELAVRLVEPGGILVSASCSMHLGREQLLDVIRSSARHTDRFAQVFAGEGQAEDHPIHPAIPETGYLKTWFTRILMNG